jgi:hypothetical protein
MEVVKDNKLWCLRRPDGSWSVGDLSYSSDRLIGYNNEYWTARGYSIAPCRLIEGHEPMVPLSLVMAIKDAYFKPEVANFMVFDNIKDALSAAIESAV